MTDLYDHTCYWCGNVFYDGDVSAFQNKDNCRKYVHSGCLVYWRDAWNAGVGGVKEAPPNKSKKFAYRVIFTA